MIEAALAVLGGLWLLAFVLVVALLAAARARDWVRRERLIRREARAADREFAKLTGD